MKHPRSRSRALRRRGCSRACGAQAQSTVYRWVDKDGKVHFSDTPPPADAKTSPQKRMGGGYADDEQLPYATQIAMQRNPVTLYTSDRLRRAVRAGPRAALQARHSRSASATRRRTRPTPRRCKKADRRPQRAGARWSATEPLKGFDEGTWHAALDARRLSAQRAGQCRRPSPPTAAAPSPRKRRRPSSAMKIATWNVNSLRVRLPHLLDWLAAHSPDAMCLQETKCEDATFPAAELAGRGLLQRCTTARRPTTAWRSSRARRAARASAAASPSSPTSRAA